MRTRTRSLRDSLIDTPGIRRILSPREIDQRETILRAGRIAMARFGRDTFSLAQFATAIHVAPTTIRRHFLDLDCLLIELLNRHLRGIADAIGAVPRTASDQHAARRAAYLAYTRKPLGGLTEDHVLLTRERWALPPDDQALIEQLHTMQGEFLGGLSPADTLSLLDTSAIDAAEIELIITHRLAQAATRQQVQHVPAVQPATREPKPAVSTRPRLAVSTPRQQLPDPPLSALQRQRDPDWPPSVYERHMAAMRARAGP